MLDLCASVGAQAVDLTLEDARNERGNQSEQACNESLPAQEQLPKARVSALSEPRNSALADTVAAREFRKRRALRPTPEIDPGAEGRGTAEKVPLHGLRVID